MEKEAIKDPCAEDRKLLAKAIQEAWDRKFDAELAKSEAVIDVPTGTVLKPGDPENCPGNGKEDPDRCCCDGCDRLEACFPR